jgi:hypothetical protein
MHIATRAGLETIRLDVRAVARQRGADLPQHPVLPPQVLEMTRYWMSRGGHTPPCWSQFDLMDAGDLVPYLTVLRCNGDGTFTFTFTGSAVSALIGEDLTGRTVGPGRAIIGEIDWTHRCAPVAETANVQVVAGAIHPARMSAIDFVAADFPFMRDGGSTVHTIVGVTVARLN